MTDILQKTARTVTTKPGRGNPQRGIATLFRG